MSRNSITATGPGCLLNSTIFNLYSWIICIDDAFKDGQGSVGDYIQSNNNNRIVLSWIGWLDPVSHPSFAEV